MKHSFIRFILPCILMVSMVINADAAFIPREEAAKKAEDFFKVANILTAKDATTNQPTVINSISDTKAYYIFGRGEGTAGFVIISADDSLQPIVGYSETDKFDAKNIPDGLKAYLSDYEKVVAAISAGKISYKKTTRGGEAISPLLNMLWNQDEPYNRLTPVIGSSHAPTGCVATAVAQVMKYYEFPPAGKGTVAPDYGNAIDLGQPYQWSEMLDRYYYDNQGNPAYTDAQGDAVALLMRDVGYALEMDYGAYESGASSTGIAAALVRNFNYSSDIVYADRSSYSNPAWIELIRGSLKAGSPVLYAGRDSQSGHQFVCDGIDSDDMLHINWGWGGYGNGYFDMNILSPEYLGIGAGNGSYYRDQDIVAYIKPGNPDADNTQWLAPLYISNIGFSGELGENNKVVDSTVLNYSVGNSTGAIIDRYTFSSALMIEDDEGNLMSVCNARTIPGMGRGYYMDYSAYLSYLLPETNLPDGHYVLKITVIDDNDRYNTPNAKPMKVYAGDLNRIGFTVRDAEYFLDDTGSGTALGDIKVTNIEVGTDNKIYTNTKNDFKITFSNNSPYAFSRQCLIYAVPEEYENDEDLANAQMLYTEGHAGEIFIYPGNTAEFTIKAECYLNNPGKYRIVIRSYYNYQEKTIPSETPMYLEVLTTPDDEIFMASALSLNSKKYARAAYQYVEADFSCNNPFNTLNTSVELWAASKEDPEAQEILLLKKDGVRLYNGMNSVSMSDWCETNAFWYGSLGEYEAYIKFKDADGNWCRLAGDNNSAAFTITPCEDEEQAILTSPMIVNGGKNVRAEDWSTFDIEFEITSPTGININPEGCDIYVCRSPRKDDWLWSFFSDKITIDKPNLSPGESTKVKVSMMYRILDEEWDLIGKTLYIFSPYIRTEDSFCWVQPENFENSMNFKFVDATAMTGMTLNYTEYTGEPGAQFYLTPIAEPADAYIPGISWETSNPYVATISPDGLVELHNEGQAIITAGCGDFTATCTVTVIDGSGIDDIYIDGNSNVTIFNTQGVRLYSGKFADANLSSGIYLVQHENGKITKRLIK